ncbi:hypothetical protein GY45DRAFT_371530 [Cubamyces sp. BRFM 1775]|nr:hypothetical protein GY45DRAFT_371530 [Cubamyces sp. BRFM 1775]
MCKQVRWRCRVIIPPEATLQRRTMMTPSHRHTPEFLPPLLPLCHRCRVKHLRTVDADQRCSVSSYRTWRSYQLFPKPCDDVVPVSVRRCLLFMPAHVHSALLRRHTAALAAFGGHSRYPAVIDFRQLSPPARTASTYAEVLRRPILVYDAGLWSTVSTLGLHGPLGLLRVSRCPNLTSVGRASASFDLGSCLSAART